MRTSKAARLGTNASLAGLLASLTTTKYPFNPAFIVAIRGAMLPYGTTRGPAKEAFVAAKQRPNSATC
jgi:hypothetical protein